MLINIDATNRIAERTALRAMYEARKRVFVDLLKWDVPVLDGRFEIDEFDDGFATYLILLDPFGGHLASARLLPTTRPTLLTSLFGDLCENAPPAGPTVYEITRFCLSRDVPATRRKVCRNMLVTALACHAIHHGIETYVGVAEESWIRQIMDFGWSCTRLGEPGRREGSPLGAIRIDIDGQTLDKMRSANIYLEPDAQRSLADAA